MDQPAPLVLDKEEDVQGLEGQGLHHEQICCPDPSQLIAEEGPPGLAWWPSRLEAPVATDRPGTHQQAKLQQLAPNALRPHSGFSLAIRPMSARTSPDRRGRPS